MNYNVGNVDEIVNIAAFLDDSILRRLSLVYHDLKYSILRLEDNIIKSSIDYVNWFDKYMIANMDMGQG